MKNMINRFDDKVDEAFGQLRGKPTADKVAYIASEAADFSIAWHIFGAGSALLAPRLLPKSVRLAVTLGAESILVNGVMKKLTNRDRPELLEDRAHEVRRPKTSSFPSGHASSATVAAVLLTDSVPGLKPVWVSLAAVVGASRIHNRMHHASDVAAGVVVGAAIGAIAKRAWKM